MKYIFMTLWVVIVGCNGDAQKPKVAAKEELYCSDSTSKGWIFDGWMSTGLAAYKHHKGKWYQDTTRMPPIKRLKQLMLGRETPRDSTIPSMYCEDFKPTVFKITECNDCDLKEVPGYIEVCTTTYTRHSIWEDTLTKKRYTGWGYGLSSEGMTLEKHYDRNKNPFSPSIKIWATKEIKQP